MAYNSLADELLYGGSAGGGKTDLLLGIAGTAHQQSIIFRRIFPSMRGMIERSREMYNEEKTTHQKDSYNESLHIWRKLDGRVIEFGSMQHEKDKGQYRGRPHDLKGWDEVTEFTKTQYTFVNAWNRTTIPGQRCRILSTANPPTSGEGEWVIGHWGPWLDSQHPNPATPGDLRWFASIGGKDTEVETNAIIEFKGEKIQPRSRTFVPARITDNPYLMEAGYESMLQSLPEPLRSQLLLGDWKAARVDDTWQVIPSAWVDAAMQRTIDAGGVMPEGSRLDVLGVDVARGGDDKTVIAKRYGVFLAPIIAYPGVQTPDGPTAAGLVMVEATSEAQINIDVIGVGSSAYDSLKPNHSTVSPINFAEGSLKRDRSGKFKMINKRAEAYWGMREKLDPVYGDGLMLPNDPELKADLCSARWSLRPGGIIIESKDDIKARIGRSPDKGDAAVLAFMDGNFITGELMY